MKQGGRKLYINCTSIKKRLPKMDTLVDWTHTRKNIQ